MDFGKVLGDARLEELPRIIDLLAGNMSLVGPPTASHTSSAMRILGAEAMNTSRFCECSPGHVKS
jgi:lipopolysaccharide/colanic/teichoic acid biosynthesis glycosyltransferase